MSMEDLVKQERENSERWNSPVTKEDSFGVYWAKVKTRRPPEDVESLEQSFRTRDIDDAFTKEAFKNVFDRIHEMSNSDLPFKSVEEYKRYVRRLDGMQDRQKITLLIKDCMEIVENTDYATDLGDEFKDEFVRLLEKEQERWFKRLSDLPEHPTSTDFEERDRRLHEHLSMIAEAAYRLSFTIIRGGEI
jgi:hypothetical protein